jgi:hypothetical protein
VKEDDAQLIPSIADIEAMFPAPKACAGPARNRRTVRVRRKVEVGEKAMIMDS